MMNRARVIQLDLWGSPEVDAGAAACQLHSIDPYRMSAGRVGDMSASVRGMVGESRPQLLSPREGHDTGLPPDANAPRMLTHPAFDMIVLPDWVPRDAWAAYMSMRNRIGVPLTGRATARAIGSLMRLRDEGHDPAAVINQSVVRSARSFSAVMSLSLPVVGEFPESASP